MEAALQTMDGLLLLGILYILTLPPGIVVSQYADEVPEIAIVYPMNNFPGKVEAFCIGLIASEKDFQKVPDYSRYPLITNSTGSIYWNNTNNSEHNARGLICKNSSSSMYPVYAPLLNSESTFLTKRLSYTVSKNEMLMIELERRYNEVMWQKEPIQTIDSNWFPSSLVKSRLSIPAGELNGTGFYSIIEKTSERKPGQHKRHFGTVAVLIRECPDSMYGEDCKQWCPDCQYGGACHPKTGKCVCPPGRRGNLCEHACIDDTSRCVWSSIKSSRPSVNLTQICLPFPYGCSCAPGYSGSKCDKACNQKSWGVDCRYTCKHCKDEKCDSVTGECEDLEMTLPCAKYSLGLPRLRRKPEVKSIGETVADVHFSYWKEKDDDGEKPPNSKLEYTVIVWEIYPGTKHDKRGNTSPAFSKKTSTASVTATGLTPGTEYEAEVLVQMSIGDDTCVEDGSWRGGRIQHTKFQTECPERVPQPKYITASNVTNSSFIVSWEELTYRNRCQIVYFVKYFPTEKPSSSVAKKDLRVSDFSVGNLSSYTNYTIQVTAHYENKDNSKYSENYTKTLPKLPGEISIYPIELKKENVSVKWSKPRSHAEGSIKYQLKYSVEYQACKQEPEVNYTLTDETFAIVKSSPFTNVSFELRMQNEAGVGPFSLSKSISIPPTVPSNDIENITCDSASCTVIVENNCRKKNGNDLKIHYKLDYVDDCRQSKTHENRNEEKIKSDGVYTMNENEFRITLPLYLLKYSYYNITPYIANSEGRNTKLKHRPFRFRTEATEPSAVRNLTASGAHNSIAVSWEPPPSCPHTGELEKYQIKWWEVIDSPESKNNSTEETSFTITHLNPERNYTVAVCAINKGVMTYGPKSTITVMTEENKPAQPNVKYNSTTNEIYVEWTDHEGEARNSSYNFTIELNGINAFNITDMHYEFRILKPGSSYNFTIRKCNRYKCSDSVSHNLWTRPLKPDVYDEPQVLEFSGNSSRISLPRVQNPPAWQYVVMTESNHTVSDDDSAQLAIDVVKNHEDTNTRDKRNVHNITQKHIKPYIAGEVFVKEDKYMDFEIGTGNGTNVALDETKNYEVVVVTKTQSGPYKSYAATKPLKLLEVASGGMAGFLYGLLTLFILVLLFVYAYRYRRRSENKAAFTEEAAIQNVDAQLCEEEPIALQDISQDNNRLSRQGEMIPSLPPKKKRQSVEPEESIYANLNLNIPFTDIEAYLARAVHSFETDMEFNSVPKNVGKSCSHGEHPENRRKNRYKNNLPYNDTRVVLPRLPRLPYSDYINASYIQGHLHHNAYIATQGPKDFNENTIHDFWRMIWHSHSHIIIMVANLMENGKVKVAQYWPDSEFSTSDGIHIIISSVKEQDDFIIRRFMLRQDNKTRKVVHYQFTMWPDHDVPQNPFGLAQMLHSFRKEYQEGPVVVHCSAGIGRTGTIILTLSVLDQISYSGHMNIKEILITLRNGRPNLVENMIQYKFAHKLLQEMLFGVQTSIPCFQFMDKLTSLREPQANTNMSLLQMQFHKIKDLPKEFTYKHALKPACVGLNRDINILPSDNRMPFLQNLESSDDAQYINAVWVRNINHMNAYLVGEHPMQHTLIKMWRLVYEKRVSVWCLIHSFLEDDEEYPEVLPKSKEEMVGKLLITTTHSETHKHFTEFHVTVAMPNSTFSSPQKCVMLFMKGWHHEENRPCSLMPLLALMEKAGSLTTARNPGLITCKDGVTGCGILMSLIQVIARIRLTKEVDVYRSVLEINYDRPQFITSEEQYDMVHEAVNLYLQCYSDYANIC